MIDNFSDRDKKDWEEFIKSDDKLFDKDFKAIKSKNIKIRSIDLHGYSLEQANQTIEKFILTSYSQSINKLIIVTGKGLHSQNEKNPYVSKDLSILKYAVPDFIENNSELMKKVVEIKDAEIKDGGSGAFYIFLKKKIFKK